MADHDAPNRPVMRALVQRSTRGPSDLVLVPDTPRPAPGPDELLIRVGAAGVNFADVMQTRGTYGGGPDAPYVAGFEAAGEVVGVGADVTSPQLGMHVVGAGPGAFAQYTTMPAAQALPVPAGWTDAAALGMVLNWATALAALRPLGGVGPGSTVVVHAAAGGVGQAAVRLARHFGARVIAIASPAKHDVIRALGVEEVLDGARSDLAAEIVRRTGGADLVLESVGKATFAASLAATRRFTGRIVVIGDASGAATLTTHDLIYRHQVQVIGLHIGHFATAAPELYQSLIADLDDLIAAGVYQPGTLQLHALADGPRVLQHIEDRRTTGKHALDPWR